MGLSDIDKVAALLPTYPYAVRAVMFGGLVVWTLAYALLVFFAPSPEPARITMARFAALVDAPRLALEFGLENNTGKAALVSEAFLQFYAGEIPEGGLATKQDVTAVYKIETQPSGGLALDDGSGFPDPVMLTRPYAGQSYQEVRIPLSQSIGDKGTDRFRIVLQDAAILDGANSHVKATLTYGSGSAAGVAELPTRP